MKITYPIAAALPGGALHNFDYELRMNSSLTITKNGNNVEIVNGNVELTISQLGTILSNGGEVEDYLMAIKAPIADLESVVHANMPDRTKPGAAGDVDRNYNDWLSPSNVWVNATNFYFLTITVAGTNLKASEIRDLHIQSGWSAILVTDPEFVAIQNA